MEFGTRQKVMGRKTWVSNNEDLFGNSHSEVETGSLAKWLVSHQKALSETGLVAPCRSYQKGHAGKMGQMIL